MLKEGLEDRIYILDGALSTELESMGFNLLHDPLWSARLLHENPEAIVEVHKNYLEKGAEIITTSSYQASISGFQKHLDVTLEKSRSLIKLSVELADKARREHCERFSKRTEDILIAASVGSYGAILADGSEYSGNYCDSLTHEDLINFHRPKVECLIEAGADLLAFETIPALKEAEALLKLLKDLPNAKAWLSFSCQSMHQTSHGENIDSVALKCLKLAPPGQLVALGVNCCAPVYAESLLRDISSVSNGFPLIVYPNSGEVWEPEKGWCGSRKEPIHSFLESCINSSARIIGGCCRTTPDDILKISKYIREQKL